MNLDIEALPLAALRSLLQPHGFKPLRGVKSGLSAANVFQCSNSEGDFACLRRWPTPNNLAWPAKSHAAAKLEQAHRISLIHRQLRILSDHGIDYVPRVYCNDGGDTVVSDGRDLWELTTWLPGTADYLQRPSEVRLREALAGVTRMHSVWSLDSRVAPSPTAQDRWLRLQALPGLQARSSQIEAACRDPLEQHLVAETLARVRTRWRPLLEQFAPIVEQPVRLHFVQRDVWSEHLLYDGERLSGIIDFGAARVDEPLTDLVRLLTTCEPSDTPRRRWGLEVYLQERERWGEFERGPAWGWERFQLYDEAATLLSAVQWLEWLIVEDREFNTPRAQLLNRWASFIQRL